MELDGTRVIVTGASTGIGRVTALRLARRGAQVWAAARDERRLEELAGEHSGIVPASADVSDDTDRAALVKQCEPVDVLVNNAGVGWPGALDYGLSPDAVAKAIMRALTRERVPGYRTITVPRIGGFSRIGSAPLMSHATDLATRGRARKALAGEE